MSMRKRRTILLLTGVVVVAFVGLLVGGAFRSREPEYEGKKLSEWVGTWQYRIREDEPSHGSGGYTDLNLQLTEKACNAIRRIVSKAVPFLLAWIRHEVPESKMEGLPRINQRLTEVRIRLDSSYKKEIRAKCALEAFRVLGPAAAGAIPELNRTLTQPRLGRSAVRAAYALGFIGEPALGPLLVALTNQPPRGLQSFICEGIGFMGTNARPAAPFLFEYLARKNCPAAFNVERILLCMRLPGPVAIPGFANCLERDGSYVKILAAEALCRFGSEARSAVPALLRLLGDPDSWVREAAVEALDGIDPEILRFDGHPTEQAGKRVGEGQAAQPPIP